MSKKTYIFRYLYDINNQKGLKSQHDQKISSGSWPPPDFDKNGNLGWWIGIDRLEDGYLTSPDYPNQQYNMNEFSKGVIVAGQEPVPVKHGTSFDHNFNPLYGKGVYLAGIELDDEDTINCIFDFIFEELINGPDNVVVTYILHRINPLSTGYLTDSTIQDETIVKILPKGTSSTITAVPTGTTIFVCWSTSNSTNNSFQTNPTFTHEANYNATYYAIIDRLDVISKQFCYYGIENYDECEDCEEAGGMFITVYFDKDELDSLGLSGSTWYDDETLTSTVQNGTYRLAYIEKGLIYDLESGIPTSVRDDCSDSSLDEC